MDTVIPFPKKPRAYNVQRCHIMPPLTACNQNLPVTAYSETILEEMIIQFEKTKKYLLPNERKCYSDMVEAMKELVKIVQWMEKKTDV